MPKCLPSTHHPQCVLSQHVTPLLGNVRELAMTRKRLIYIFNRFLIIFHYPPMAFFLLGDVSLGDVSLGSGDGRFGGFLGHARRRRNGALPALDWFAALAAF